MWAAPSRPKANYPFCIVLTHSRTPSASRLTVAEFLDRVKQHIDRVKAAPALEWPAPLLIRLDQRHKNVELVACWRSNGRTQSFSISASAARWSLSVRIGRICMIALIKTWHSQSINGVVFSVRANKFHEHNLPTGVGKQVQASLRQSRKLLQDIE